MPGPGPLALHAETVRPEWIDYNGHMNVAYYVLAFDHATDALLDHLGMDAAYRERTGCSNYVVEAHVTYLRELRAGAPIRCTTQLLDADPKRMHFFHRMLHGERGILMAGTELVSLHVDVRAGRAAPFPAGVRARIEALQAEHALLARPEQVCGVMGLAKR